MITHFFERSGRVAVLCGAVPCLFLLLILAGCGGRTSKSSHTPVLTSLTVVPRVSTIALGRTVQFRAIGVFSDGSSRDQTQSVNWRSGDSSIASIDHQGHATSVSVGKAILIAQSSDLFASASLTVSKAAVVSISVDPPEVSLPQGASAQLKVTAVDTDGGKLDVTDSTTWEIDQPQIATISSAGTATSKIPGVATLTASSRGMVASCRVTVVEPALTAILIHVGRSAIPLGTAIQLTASGTYTDGSIHDVTSLAVWSSVPAGVVMIDSLGRASGKAMGTASIKAESEKVSASMVLTVTAATLASIEVQSGSAVIPLGARRQLAAQGTYTDGTTVDVTKSAVWLSDSKSIVSISTGGEAGALAMGTAMVSASVAGASGKAIMTVGSPALASIVITPGVPIIPLESRLQLTSLGVFTDGTTQDLTPQSSWSISDANIVSVSGVGVAAGLKVGSTIVTVASEGIVGSATIVVQPVTSVDYFSSDSNGSDTTIRLTNPGGTGSDLCTMVYVFNQNQQLAECCGCAISVNGLRTLSLSNDLISNPLTGVRPISGTMLLVTSDYDSNSSCTPSSFSSNGLSLAWATHLQHGSNDVEVLSEAEFSRTPLPTTLASSLQAQCMFIEQLGSGRGICSCGTGD